MSETILLVEDEPLQRRATMNLLSKKLGYKVLQAEHGKDALACLRTTNFGEVNAILLDINMPVMDGFETLEALRKTYPDIPVIMLTGSEDTDEAVQAIKLGASDFIVKPPRPDTLQASIQQAILGSGLARRQAQLRQGRSGVFVFSQLIGHDCGLEQAVMLGRKVAKSDVPVLLTGESGTGKEGFARAIHGEGARQKKPFIAINCGTMSESVESILFGDEAGSQGKIREAEGGTLFLDDIQTLPAGVQIRLLHLLQHKQIESLRFNRSVKVNVRLISACESDLKREVQAGRFREDLYFRLNVLPIALPALRERKQDIPALCEHLIRSIAISDNLPIKPLTKEALGYVLSQRWPANVRELEALLHRALVYADDMSLDRELLEMLHDTSDDEQPIDRRKAPDMHLNLRQLGGKIKSMQQIECEAMQMTLDHLDGNITVAAETLGMAKSTFYRKLKDC